MERLVTRFSRKPIHMRDWWPIFRALAEHASRYGRSWMTVMRDEVEAALHLFDPGILVRLPPTKLRRAIGSQLKEATLGPEAGRTRLRTAGPYSAPLPREESLDRMRTADLGPAVRAVAENARTAAEVTRRLLADWDALERVANRGERSRLELLRVALLPDCRGRCRTVAGAKKLVAAREGVTVGAIDKMFSELRMRAAR